MRYGANRLWSTSSLPSGSRNVAMWQTPRLDGLAVELDALRLELGARRLDVVDVEQRDRVRLRLELLAPLLGHPDREARVAGPELALRVLVGPQAERLDVEPPRPLPIS